MKLFVLLFLTSIALAQGEDALEASRGYYPEEIVFSNRASCAKDANTPTKKVFLLIDNVNIAKAAFRVAKVKGIDPVQMTNLATAKFRYTIIKLITLISDKLIQGKLPLVEDEKNSFEYLKKNWKESEGFMPPNTLSCHVVKKWGSLHSYLNVSKPDRFVFESMAKELEKLDETLSSCDDFLADKTQEVELLELSLQKKSDFEQFGFQFWYSLKIYLSWAFRFSTEMQQLAAPFDYLFKSTDLEEMIFFLSAGCESMSRPECSQESLNLEHLGELTLPKDKFDFFGSNRIKPVSDSPTEPFFSKPLPLKEDDLLNLTKFSNSQDWAVNFRNHFIKTRGYQKIRLGRVMTDLNIIQTKLSSDVLMPRIIDESKHTSFEWRKDFYYLCSEYGVAQQKLFSNLTQDLKKLLSNGMLPEIATDLSLQGVDGSIALYFDLSSKLRDFCKTLEAQDFWKDLLVEKKGFAPWYLQLTRDEIQPTIQSTSLTSLSNQASYLRFNNQEPFCRSAVHCARILLDSLYSLSSLSHSFFTIRPTEINSANLGNPYANHVACGAYDPWAKKNKMLREFFHDLAQSAIFGFLPTPVYVSADFSPGELVSFEELMKNGKVFYDPQYSSKSVSLSLIADLGMLIGLPCSVSISGSKINPLEYYSFNGISLSSCVERSRNVVTVEGEDDISSGTKKRHFCASCSINLKSITSSLSSVNPGFRFSSFLLKSIVRLSKNLKDPHDLPRSWVVSPQAVVSSYQYWGEISKSCTRKLLKGKSCLPKHCLRHSCSPKRTSL